MEQSSRLDMRKALAAPAQLLQFWHPGWRPFSMMKVFRSVAKKNLVSQHIRHTMFAETTTDDAKFNAVLQTTIFFF